MIIESLKTLYSRDLTKLKAEILLYTDEQNIWKTSGEITNSAGNLCLHIVGNLNAYIGSQLGKTDYIRNRPLEFSTKYMPTQELVRMIDDTISIIEKTLHTLTDEDLMAEYPLIVFEHSMTTAFFLIHLESHLMYHLGQINYHRRLIDI